MENNEWRECFVFSSLEQSIPDKIEIGYKNFSLQLTALDSFSQHLVLGTNSGLAYIVHLPTLNFIKLICEDKLKSITSVCAVSTIDDMVAAGSEDGVVTIFKLPHVPFVTFKNSSIVKRLTVPNLHHGLITCFCWSRNGMKLFCGDKFGSVSLIEINYQHWSYSGTCIVNGEYEIIQLDYRNFQLLISTKERCLICDTVNYSLTQVGTKVRKPAGFFGAVWYPSIFPKDYTLYATRPGLRLWKAQYNNVESTLQFGKALLSSSSLTLDETTECSPYSIGFLFFIENVIVSYNSNCVIMLNPNTVDILMCFQAVNEIIDVSVCDGNIYVLECSKRLRCFSRTTPNIGTEKIISDSHYSNKSFNPDFTLLYNLGSSLFNHSSAIIDEVVKIKGKVAEHTGIHVEDGICPTMAYSSVHNLPISENDSEQLSSCCNDETMVLKYSERGGEKNDFEFNGDTAGEQLVIHGSLNKKTKKKNGTLSIKEERSEEYKENNHIKLKDNKDGALGQENSCVPSLINDNRTFDDFKFNIQENEDYLASILDLDCLKMDHEAINSSNNLVSEESFSTITDKSVDESTVNSFDLKCNSVLNLEFFHPPAEKDKCDDNIRTECDIKSPENSSISNLPSDYACDSSNALENCETLLTHDDTNFNTDNSVSTDNEFFNHNYNFISEELCGKWIKYYMPDKIESLSGSSSSIFLYCAKQCFVSENNGYTWQNCYSNLKIVSASSNCTLICCLMNGSLSLYKIDNKFLKDLNEESKLFISSAVKYACIDETSVWYIKQTGEICIQPIDIYENPYKLIIKNMILLKSGEEIKEICCKNGVIWALTYAGHILYRIGISSYSLSGHEWGKLEGIDFPVCSCHLMDQNDQNIGWIIDIHKRLYFRPGICKAFPQGCDNKWWQVDLKNYSLNIECEHYLWASTANYICFSEFESKFLFIHSTDIIGHNWMTVLNDETWSLFTCEGLSSVYPYISTLSFDGKLFFINTKTLTTLLVDFSKNEKIIMLSQRPLALWILTLSGKIFIRGGIEPPSFIGNHWTELDMSQIEDVHICHISIGTNLVWATDTKGAIYMREGPLEYSSSQATLLPAWIELDHTLLEGNAYFTKVFVGLRHYMVWALDSKHRLYVRESIFPDFPIGTSWYLVKGIRAVHLSISESEVFALTPNGEIHKRIGISEKNYVGDEWIKILGDVSNLSVTPNNCLWGLNAENQLIQHSVVNLADWCFPRQETPHELLNHSEDCDWEIL